MRGPVRQDQTLVQDVLPDEMGRSVEEERPNSALLCLLPVDDWRRRPIASPEGAANPSVLLELPDVLDLERIPIELELELACSYAPLTLDSI